MIDFHTHILPNIDDGARTEEETLLLLKEAEEAGFNKVVLTPHYIENYYETNEEERTKLLEKLQQKASNLQLYLANEIYFSENITGLIQESKASTIHHTKYLLFEFPMNNKPFNIYDVIYEIQRLKMVPILAHPERYTFIQSDPNLAYDLVQRGVLMQQNYGSILGQYGKKAQVIAKSMLEHEMVHFLGSDVHRPNTIYPNMPKILKKLENVIGEDKIYELTTQNPSLVLENQEIQMVEPKSIQLGLKEKWQMLKK